MALSMLSSSLSFQAGAAPKSVVTRTAVSMQLAPALGERLGSATFAGGVVPTKGRYEQGIDSAILVQGGSLRTWSYRSPAIEQVQVVLSTEGRPLDAATKSEFDYILAAVPHALLWPVIDAWLPGPANSNNHPDYAVPGLENLVLRNLSGNPSVTDTFNFNVSPNEAYIMQAEAQLKGFMRLIDKLYPRKIFGVQVNNLETTEWFLPGAWDAQGSVHTFGTQYADYSNTTAIEFCGEVGCLPSPLERDTGAGSSNVFSSNRSAAFNYYLSARSARAFTRLARAAKNVSGGKAFVGSY